RLNWLPIIPKRGEQNLLHLGVMGRYGKTEGGQITMRSRPESFPSPYFVDTGKIAADHTRMAGGEIYYRPGPWLFGSEYWVESVASPSTNNPFFQGGDVVATWLVTGEVRDYNMVGGSFRQISPKRSVFQGGPGAWEIVMRESYIDLNDGVVQGGKFW